MICTYMYMYVCMYTYPTLSPFLAHLPLLYMSAYYYMCPDTTTCVSSYSLLPSLHSTYARSAACAAICVSWCAAIYVS